MSAIFNALLLCVCCSLTLVVYPDRKGYGRHINLNNSLAASLPREILFARSVQCSALANSPL
jgi:hypothetical protein